MAELSLEALAARLAAVEKKLTEQSPAPPAARKKDWRRTIGMFAGSEFIKEMDAEVEALRDADREAARTGAQE